MNYGIVEPTEITVGRGTEFAPVVILLEPRSRGEL